MTVYEPAAAQAAAVHARDVASFFEGLDHLRETDEGYTAAFPGVVPRTPEPLDMPAPDSGSWPVEREPSPPNDQAPTERDALAAGAGVPATPELPLGASHPAAEDAPQPGGGAAHEVSMEPPARPWPAILSDVATRVVRHRGAKLAAQFTAALGRALEEHGGRIDGDRIVAPPLPESTWRGIVEAGCAPITAVAGRAFVDRTIAAAERAVLDADGSRE
jgi:hypothetical protein